MPIYLEDHPPARTQFRRPRRATATGLIVVHTAESVMDTIDEDTGAENVAAFIANRSDPGSYHTLVDSDSIVQLVRFSAEAYGDGTGSNPFAIHISFACRTTDWAKMSKERRAAFLRNGARAAAQAARWVKRVHGIEVPPARVTKAQSDAGEPGFISHGERDPGRRTDPGVDFPWPEFLGFFVDEMAPPPRFRPTIKATTTAIKRGKRDRLPKRFLRRLRRLRRDMRAARRKRRG